MPGADVEAELILMAARLWKSLGLQDISLQLNSLGTSEDRSAYKEVLVSYFNDHLEQLDEDSQRRLGSNPLRILDSKNPDMQTLIEAAPKLQDHLCSESKEHFNQLLEILDFTGQPYTINTRLVRGLDYYCHTVFEWVTDSLGAQGTVCAGGRYDALVEQLGGKPTFAAGFAMGVERLVTMLIDQQQAQAAATSDIYFVVVGDKAVRNGHKLAEQLRDQLPDIQLVLHAGGGSFKSQFKKADKSGATLALILGEDEVEKDVINIKFLRDDRDQLTLPQQELTQQLAKLFNEQSKG
jgi:histidyl-tRNA synthetase